MATSLVRAPDVDKALEDARAALEDSAERQKKRQAAYGLTSREVTVLVLLAAGTLSDGDIAEILGISHLTASTHVTRILVKLRAKTRTEAAVRALKEDLVY